MKIRVAQAQGLALNWLVAKCQGADNLQSDGIRHYFHMNKATRILEGGTSIGYAPSTNWSQGGPIIEREISKLFKNMCGTYTAQIRHEEHHSKVLLKILVGYTNCAGPTPLIAAMRCYVASKLGEEVEVPDELVKG